MPRSRKSASSDAAQAQEGGAEAQGVGEGLQGARIGRSGTVKTGMTRLSEEQIATFSGAQLRAVAQQRGYKLTASENPGAVRADFTRCQDQDPNLANAEDLGLTVHPRTKAFVQSGAASSLRGGLGNVVGGGSRLTGRTQDAAYVGPTPATEPHDGTGEQQPLRGNEVEEASDPSYLGEHLVSVEESRQQADAATGIPGGAPKQESVEPAASE